MCFNWKLMHVKYLNKHTHTLVILTEQFMHTMYIVEEIINDFKDVEHDEATQDPKQHPEHTGKFSGADTFSVHSSVRAVVFP